MVKTNLENIHKRIEQACARVGRSSSEVSLVAVTKTVPVEMIKEAVLCGEKILGENRALEMSDKFNKVNGVSWHLIGHLQTNKVKYVVGKAELIHSVDSLRLLEAIDAEAEKKGIVQNILLEVNISGEESKYGLTIDEIADIIEETVNLRNIRFQGFMTMAPLGADEKDIRAIFRRARELKDKYADSGADILSMGMSGDFEIAVEEGATHIRVGSAIFK